MRSNTKFSPGSVPESNHIKTLNMCLVNSYFFKINICTFTPELTGAYYSGYKFIDSNW